MCLVPVVCSVCDKIIYEDDQCVWYVLQNVCMACVCDNVRG